MIVIDGSQGEGGGQVLRNALALSLITGTPFRIHNIRGGRERPGLMRQHLTAIQAACAIGGAECDGAGVGAAEITFRPGTVRAGDYRFAIGTAGSTGLVLQTVLPPLLLAGAPSRLVLEGGTHNPQAPPFEFLDRSLFSILNRMGPRVAARLIRHGFHPVGGGALEVDITPSPLRRIECLERGTLHGVRATALIAGLPGDIAVREIAKARQHLDWPHEAFRIQTIDDNHGPGNVLLLEAEFEHVTEIVSGFGRMGLSGESLAKTAAARMSGYLASNAFAGPYLQDQLILPFMLAGGGSFTTVKPSGHMRTAADIGALFLSRQCRIAPRDDGAHLVTVH